MTAIPSVYRGLFSAAVATSEMCTAGDPAMLYPAEAAHLKRAAPQRAREFAAGRWCARRALAEFGITDFPVRVAADRQPIWPDSMVGSITHTDGFCGAVVGRRSEILGIGIDSEVVAPVTPALFARICVAEETDWVDSLPTERRAGAVMLIFCVKEAFYKCQYPIVGEWLDFKDLCVELVQWREDQTPAQFVVRPTRPTALAHRVPMPVHGLYVFHEQFVSAGVALHAEA